MTPDERQLLEGLFERIKQSANVPRDRDAEALIGDAVRAQPYAPYLMAQAVIVQEEGLKAAAARIQELEAKLADAERQQAGGGSFLGGLGKTIFGDSGPARTGSGVPAFGRQAGQQPQAPSGPWGAQPPQAGMGAPGFGAQPPGGMFGGGGGAAGGGFLRSAMTTAAGVAGGALLFSGIQSLFNSHGSGLMAGNTLLDQPGNLSSSVSEALGGTPQADPASSEGFTGGDSDPTLDDASFDDSFDDGGAGDDGGDWA